ncbi:amidohydrolase [Crassaminicella thermophila]|uniref:Amidohydrolase n=1 Tax=Crassaminicella thermophila TaxID=2599308 RepID=A0A5C0SHY4_CRATE|nr:amidohydrolase [Crassaminicella thermophila]QEK13034.1 amidohydrolase [Crassaminicella thermophila]
MDGQIYEELVDLRREFHKCAEVGWLEYETTIKIIHYLKLYGLEVIYGKHIHSERMGLPSERIMQEHIKNVSNLRVDFDIEEILKGYTGAVGILDTKKPGPIIALRFDIDGNAVDEDKKEEHRPYKEKFISKNKGMMHACGHDGHIAIGLSLAKNLSKQRKKLFGKILFIFQPAEEGVRGAKSLIGAGILKDVNYILSGHIGFMGKKNQVICGVDGFLATSKLDIYYYGKASHAGAYPEQGKNALLAGANCAINLHTLCQFSQGMSRINVGVLNAGTGRNVVPSYAKLEIETRGETQEINNQLLKRVYEVIEGSGKLYDVSYEVRLVGSAPAYNCKDEEFISFIENLLKECDFEVINGATMRASEDITYMFHEVEKNKGKAIYMVFGTSLSAPHHHSSFDFDEDVLLNAYMSYMKIIRYFMHQQDNIEKG